MLFSFNFLFIISFINFIYILSYNIYTICNKNVEISKKDLDKFYIIFYI